MGPAADLPDAARPIQRVVSRVGVRLQIAREGGEKRLRAFALVGQCRIEDDLACERIQVGPDPALATAGLLEDRDRRVIGLEIRRRDDVAPQFGAQWRQRGGHVGDPAAERGPREIQVLAIEDPFQAIERQMIDVLGDDDVREEACARERPLNRLRRRGRWGDAVMTVRTRVRRPHRFNHAEARRHIIEFLRHGFADACLQRPAGAPLLRIRHVDLNALPRQRRR